MALTPRFPVEIGNLELIHQGKTRDTFRATFDDLLAQWASNRLSTHDVVHKSLINLKGEVLTALTVYWLEHVLGTEGIKHHLVAYGSKVYQHLSGSPRDYPKDFHLRTLIVRKKIPETTEFVYRNRLDGSLFNKFHKLGRQNPYGVEIPVNMQRMEAFPQAIFTPTTKSDSGDEPQNARKIQERYQRQWAMGDKIVAIATRRLRARGIELIDTKLEFGGDTLIDEVLTPDSSRFTRLADIVAGKAPVSLDKQIVRDEAVRLCGGRDPTTGLKFSYDIEQKLTATYLRCFEEVVGMSLGTFQGMYME